MEGNIRNRETFSSVFLSLSVLFISILLVCNVISGKIVVLGGIVVQASDVFFPLTCILSDVMTEVYGFRRFKYVIWLGFVVNFFSVLVYLLAVWLPHPEYWTRQEAYSYVFMITPRIFVASLVAYLLGGFSNSIIMSKLKVMMTGRMLWVRTIGSSVIGNGLDSVAFCTIVLAGSLPPSKVAMIIGFQFCLKMSCEIAFTPITYAATGWLKRHEGLDTYDIGVDYRILPVGK